MDGAPPDSDARWRQEAVAALSCELPSLHGGLSQASRADMHQVRPRPVAVRLPWLPGRGLWGCRGGPGGVWGPFPLAKEAARPKASWAPGLPALLLRVHRRERKAAAHTPQGRPFPQKGVTWLDSEVGVCPWSLDPNPQPPPGHQSSGGSRFGGRSVPGVRKPTSTEIPWGPPPSWQRELWLRAALRRPPWARGGREIPCRWPVGTPRWRHPRGFWHSRPALR